MTKLLNIHFTFSCRTSHKNNDGRSPMILRLTFRGERREMFTGLYCFSINWNAREQRIEKKENGSNLLNQNLDLILRKAINAFDELKFSGDEFTIGELVDKIRAVKLDRRYLFLWRRVSVAALLLADVWAKRIFS